MNNINCNNTHIIVRIPKYKYKINCMYHITNKYNYLYICMYTQIYIYSYISI